MSEHRISLTVNGRERTLWVDAHRSLLEVLRADAGATEVKLGCGEGVCGTCAVLLDGEPVNACLVFAVQADGASVTTVRGLAPEGEFHPLQTAFLEHAGSQCGFCTPGMILTAHWYLGGHRTPTARRSGPRWPAICAAVRATPRSSTRSRHTATAPIARRQGLAVDAREVTIGLASEVTIDAPDRPAHEPARATRRAPHRDFVEKVAGTLRYADDWAFPGMLHGVVVRAQTPSARIRNVDVSAAHAVRGVRAVLTAADIPHNAIHDEASGLGVDPIVQPVLAEDRVRYDGEPVAVRRRRDPAGGRGGGRAGRRRVRRGAGRVRCRAGARAARPPGARRRQPLRDLAIGDRRRRRRHGAGGRRGRGDLPQPARRSRVPGTRGRDRLDRLGRRAHAAGGNRR